jgi:putative DNA primase/helicase
MIAGAVEWQRVGLNPPAAVLDATSEYMNDEAEDILSAWLHDCCDKDREAKTKSGDLYRSYKFYAEQAGEKPATSTLLSKDLKALGYNLERTSEGRFVCGLKLKPPPPAPPWPAPVSGQ